jgi:hypothetical protein
LWSHTREARELWQPVSFLGLEFEIVRKKKHERKPSPSPLMESFAGGNPTEKTDGEGESKSHVKWRQSTLERRLGLLLLFKNLGLHRLSIESQQSIKTNAIK